MATVRELLTAWYFDIDDRPLQQLESKIVSVKDVAKAVGIAIGGAAVGLFGLAEATRRHIDDLDEMAQGLGVSVEWLTQFSAAAKLSGAEVDDIATSMTVLQRKMYEARKGGEDAQKAFAAIGIRVSELRKMRPEEAMERVGFAVGQIQDKSKRASLAFELFGRSARRLIPTFAAGEEAVHGMAAEAEAFGLVPGPAAVEAANQMELAMARAKGVVGGLGMQIGTALMPVVSGVADRFTKWAQANREVIASKIQWFVEMLSTALGYAWDITLGTIDAIRWLARAFKALVPWIEVAAGAMAGLAVAFVAANIGNWITLVGILATALQLRLVMAIKAVWAAMMANPIGLILAALGVAIVLIIQHWDSVKAALLAIWDALGVAWDYLTSGIAHAVEAVASVLTGIWNGVASVFKSIWQGIADWFNEYIVAPITKVWDIMQKAAHFVGIGTGGGGTQSHSPGRPGSPESGLTPDGYSTGLRYNPAFATLPSGMSGGGRSVNVQSTINFTVPAGMSTTQVEEIESRFRRAAREEIGRAARDALLDMG